MSLHEHTLEHRHEGGHGSGPMRCPARADPAGQRSLDEQCSPCPAGSHKRQKLSHAGHKAHMLPSGGSSAQPTTWTPLFHLRWSVRWAENAGHGMQTLSLTRSEVTARVEPSALLHALRDVSAAHTTAPHMEAMRVPVQLPSKTGLRPPPLTPDQPKPLGSCCHRPEGSWAPHPLQKATHAQAA
jgi:hypothetical protein